MVVIETPVDPFYQSKTVSDPLKTQVRRFMKPGWKTHVDTVILQTQVHVRLLVQSETGTCKRSRHRRKGNRFSFFEK